MPLCLASPEAQCMRCEAGNALRLASPEAQCMRCEAAIAPSLGQSWGSVPGATPGRGSPAADPRHLLARLDRRLCGRVHLHRDPRLRGWVHLHLDRRLRSCSRAVP